MRASVLLLAVVACYSVAGITIGLAETSGCDPFCGF